MNESGRRFYRRKVTEWVTLYRSVKKRKDGTQETYEVKVTSFSRPTKYRIFRVAAKPGRRKFKAVAAKQTTKEVIIVAKNKGRTKKDEEVLTEDELEDLEDLEDLDDLEDEDVEDEDVEDDEEFDEDEDEDESEDEEDDEDELDEDDDDEDEDEDDEEEEEAPAPKKSRKSKSKKSSKTKTKEGVGTQEVAEAAGVDGRTLRMVLRKHNIEKDPDSGQYRWSSLKHPEVKKIIRLVKERGEGKKVKKESLDNLKNRKTKKSRSKATKTSRAKKTRKRSK